jgi:hypothetical protein
MRGDGRRPVPDELMPDLHGPRANARADFSFARAVSSHCRSGNLAAVAPGGTTPAATRRRLQRTPAQDRLAPEAVGPQGAPAGVGAGAGGPITLILDEAPNRNDWRCLTVTRASRQRALPRRGAGYALGGPPEPRPEGIAGRLRRAAAGRPAGAEVTLLADRGRAGPRVVDACRGRGGPVVTRLRGPTRVRAEAGRECTAAERAPEPGSCWRGRAEVFKQAGWRAAAVAASGLRGRDGPWRRVSDREDGPRRFGRHRKRTWAEGLSRDEESSGSPWGQGPVVDPAPAARRVRRIAPATDPASGLGSRVIPAGRRRLLETTRRRMLRLFQIGLRSLMFGVTDDRPWPGNLSPVPP